MIRSLALSTDLMVQGAQSTLEPRGDLSILRTPDQPTFWFGNAVILHEAPGDANAERLIQMARDAFPQAGHVCLQWDVPDMILPAPLVAEFTDRGFDIEVSDTLHLDGPLIAPDLPSGLIVRHLESDTDWRKSLDLAFEIGVEEGYDPVSHRPYLSGQIAARRGRVEGKRGAWFGVFEGDLMVAQMGILHGERLIRYQDVQTRASHRRRGICAALLGHAGRWAVAQAPEAQVVIVAGADSAAGRLYRRAGFKLAERLTSAVKGSYASGLSAAVT